MFRDTLSIFGHQRREMSHYLRSDDCEPAEPDDTVTDRLNTLLNSSGSGYVLSLCPSQQYLIQSPILFAAPQQEISTLGYPTDDTRATLVVSGAIINGAGQTTAVDGTCQQCDGVILRNIQINGSREDAPLTGGANIEMGGSNSGQLIEYVHSYNPRGWSCLHITEGALDCSNATVQNNDIGPCGSDAYQEWADGISVSCSNSLVQNNMVNNPTDGGIVLFGSPGTIVQNNTIWVVNQTLLGGVNMVDYLPWSGDYTGTIVRNNTILGGFANEQPDNAGDADGTNGEDAIIKIGIAIGPETWFGDEYGTNVSTSGTVLNNRLSGAFSYAIAITSATNFTVQGNTLFGNTSFIGGRGPNCSTSDTTPTPAAFIIETDTTTSCDIQSDFQSVTDAESLTCVLPPDGGDYWPFGGNPATTSQSALSSHSGSKAGMAIGIVIGIAAVAVGSWFLRKWALRRAEARALYKQSRQESFKKYNF